MPSLGPLLRAGPIIALHATAAGAAPMLGIVQLARRKGTRSHSALVVAGLFTLAPGRIMHHVIFGY